MIKALIYWSGKDVLQIWETRNLNKERKVKNCGDAVEDCAAIIVHRGENIKELIIIIIYKQLEPHTGSDPARTGGKWSGGRSRSCSCFFFFGYLNGHMSVTILWLWGKSFLNLPETTEAKNLSKCSFSVTSNHFYIFNSSKRNFLHVFCPTANFLFTLKINCSMKTLWTWRSKTNAAQT